ncbi:MAG: hypothetical protein ACE5M4_00200 [Anaerolineales bacterium]
MANTRSTLETTNRGGVVVGLLLIATGLVFFVANLLPGIDLGSMWPGLFYAVGLALLLPPWILPSHRQALAGLIIPGMLLIVLGVIFTYLVITDDWQSWAYIWALIPASVGTGLWIAARFGFWGPGASTVGLWMLAGSLVAFAIFAAFLGGEGPLAKGAPLALIALGVVVTGTALVRIRSD